MKLNLNDLVRSCEKRRPRVHPNGFIQLDLTPDGCTRLHVWPDSPLSAQKTRHPIHDHIFDMMSTVIRGQMINKILHFVEDLNGSYALYKAESTENPNDTVLRPIGERGDLVVTHTERISAGESYFVPAFYMHDSEAIGLTATIMTKLRTRKDSRPLIAVPDGVEPDNDYRRDSFSDCLLWSWIERAIQ